MRYTKPKQWLIETLLLFPLKWLFYLHQLEMHSIRANIPWFLNWVGSCKYEFNQLEFDMQICNYDFYLAHEISEVATCKMQNANQSWRLHCTKWQVKFETCKSKLKTESWSSFNGDRHIHQIEVMFIHHPSLTFPLIKI